MSVVLQPLRTDAVIAVDDDHGHGHDRRWATLAVLCLSLVLISVDNTILNVAIPTLARELDATGSQLQWIVDSYVLVFAGLLLTGGALGDRFGRRGALQIGMAVFAVGSTAAAWATSATQLIACRSLMGLGAALIMPATLSILTNVFRDPAERARAIGIWSGCAALGVVIGPLAGGWLLEHFWWGSVFLVNLPLLAIALVAAARVVPTSRDDSAPRIDLGGSLLSIGGFAALLWAIIEAPNHGWTDPRTLAGFAAAAALLAGFLAWESRTAAPMLDLGVFRHPRFSAASGAIMLSFFALFGSMFVTSQHLQSVMGYSALEAGVRYLPFAGVLLVVAPMSARLAERFGTKAVVAVGLLLIAVGQAWMLRVEADSSYGDLLPGLLVAAAGMALSTAPATEAVMGALPREKAGVGSAVNDTTRELGGALGVAVLGSVLASTFRDRMTEALAPLALSGEAHAVATESVGGALAVADEVGGAPGQQLADGARSAFVEGMHSGVVVAAGVALLGALVVLVGLPARAEGSVDHPGETP